MMAGDRDDWKGFLARPKSEMSCGTNYDDDDIILGTIITINDRLNGRVFSVSEY